jgi:hypothetical protein
MMKIDDVLNKKVGLCGVDGNAFCLLIDGKRVAFEAIEDESDGYRSMLEDVPQVKLKGHIFFRTPVASVVVKRRESSDRSGCGFDGYVVEDMKDGHIWLEFGTNRDDGYYPLFVFRYVPPHVCSCRVCDKEMV